MGTEVANYDKKWADQARQYADTYRTKSAFISHRAGVFKCGDEQFEELCVVILASVFENTYYKGAWDSDNLAPPVCYAFGEHPKDMEPHPAMQASTYFEPQNDECSTCPMNQFGTKGKGKACKNGVRLSLIPAGVYRKKKGSRDLELEEFITDDAAETAEHLTHTEAMSIKLPPLSVREFNDYVQLLNREYRRPPAGVMTRMWTAPMDKGGHKICFEPIALLPDDTFPIIEMRAASAKPGLVQAYAAPEEEASPKLKGLKGVRRD